MGLDMGPVDAEDRGAIVGKEKASEWSLRVTAIRIGHASAGIV